MAHPGAGEGCRPHGRGRARPALLYAGSGMVGSEVCVKPGADGPLATQIDAVLERITYASEETGYTIARVATDRSGAELLTVVGPLLRGWRQA